MIATMLIFFGLILLFALGFYSGRASTELDAIVAIRRELNEEKARLDALLARYKK